jgi:hypothetical protein
VEKENETGRRAKQKRSGTMYATLVKKGQTEVTCPVCGETLKFEEVDVYVGDKHMGKLATVATAVMTKNGMKIFKCEHLRSEKCEWYRCQNGDWLALIRDADDEPKP